MATHTVDGMPRTTVEQHRLLLVPQGTPIRSAIADGLASLGREYEYVRGSRLDDGQHLLRFRRRPGTT